MLTANTADAVSLQGHAERGRVRGFVIQMHVDWLRDHGSRGEIIELFESLPAMLRHQVLAAQPAQWYRFSTLVELQRMVAVFFGSGETRFLEQIGMYATEKQLAPIRKYLHPSLLHDHFRRSAALHHDALDFGAAEYREITDDAGRMTISGLQHAPSHRAFLSGSCREAIHQHGALDATIVHTSDGTFDISWGR